MVSGTQTGGKKSRFTAGILRSRTAVAAALFVLSLAACLLFVFSFPLPEVRNDAVGYLEVARNVAAGKGFTQDGSTPVVYRPPLFSALLGGWFFLTGTSSVFSAAIFQSLLHSLGVSAAFFLFLAFTPSLPWAAAASVFLAVNPLLVTRVVFVLQEPALLLVTTLAILASFCLVRSPSPGRAALAGAVWGLCTLGKVVAWFAPFLLLAMRILPARLRWSCRGKEAAALLFCFAAVILPWTVRNYIHFGRFVPVNAQGVGMLEWNVGHAEIPGVTSGMDTLAGIKEKNLPVTQERAALWKYVASNPRYFFVDRVIRNALTFGAPPRDWWIARGYSRPGEHPVSYWILAGLFHMPLYLFLLFRTWQWGSGRTTAPYGVILLFYWSYWAEHALVWGDPRFGLAVYPLLVATVVPPSLRGSGEKCRPVTGERG